MFWQHYIKTEFNSLC
uniref:Uncharacterized protein n=1 Tax=Anguilla anguilla TaxID=7936 RepID=A0A0E9QRR2_ANGAN